MGQYVDGYVIPIPKKNVKVYKKMALLGCKTWMKHGALSYFETTADDYAKWGLGFKAMCKLKASETVIFAFIVYKSKSHRNQVNTKVMKEFAAMGKEMIMPFDMKRFSSAGFKVLVSSKKK